MLKKLRSCVAALAATALAGGAAVPAQSQESPKSPWASVVSTLPSESAVLVTRDGATLYDGTDIIVGPGCGKSASTCSSNRAYRWASITKQVTAVLILQEAAKGKIDLDAPVSRYLPGFKGPNAARISVRQLLRHQSGLPNPDDTAPGEGGMASYYLPGYTGNRDPLTGYCAGPAKGEPGAEWAYNNCDYIVAGALLERVTGTPLAKLFQRRIAKPLKLKSLRYGGTTRTRDFFSPTGGGLEPDIDLGAFGAAGGLHGAPHDLIRFDQALMDGKLLPAKYRDQLWDGQADLGYIALGQWVFEAPLKGCDAPVKIVERRGAIGKVQVRNFILPDRKVAAAVFVGSADFDFGEIWMGSGFSHDLLASAACS
jgi:CubicO group peptidase (beta-lactamase class C family)